MTALYSLAGTFDCRTDSLPVIERALSSDRHGEIRAVIVEARAADTVRAIMDRCWHDAAVIVAGAEQPLARAA